MTRTKVIKLRVTAAEHAALTGLGKPLGGVSALIRRRCLDPVSSEPSRDAIRELARLAHNLNLIAVQARTLPANRTVEVIAHLIAIERRLAEALLAISHRRPRC